VADRIFKGRLQTERSGAFPESSEAFDKPHAGGLVPFELLRDIMEADVIDIKMVQGVLWVSADDAWCRVERDGTIEIGIAGV
jgi:hypothetical protein